MTDNRWASWPPMIAQALRKHFPLCVDPVTVYKDAPAVAAKPRRKPLGPKQLRWLRKNVQPFRDLETLTRASKDGVAPMGAKAARESGKGKSK